MEKSIYLNLKGKNELRPGALVVVKCHMPDTSALFAARPHLLAHVGAMLDSYRRLTGRELLERSGALEDDARRLFEAPFAALSHGLEADPVLNFGNRVALALWERDFDAFTRIPSRLTVEPMLRDARERLLRVVAAQGYIDHYEGVRISAGGQRFRIAGAVVWNVSDSAGRPLGQAAAFDRWTFLEP
jgi:hypothetical protein